MTHTEGMARGSRRNGPPTRRELNDHKTAGPIARPVRARLPPFGSPTVLHATGEMTEGRFCLLEQVTMPPGLASPYHTHHH